MRRSTTSCRARASIGASGRRARNSTPESTPPTPWSSATHGSAVPSRSMSTAFASAGTPRPSVTGRISTDPIPPTPLRSRRSSCACAARTSWCPWAACCAPPRRPAPPCSRRPRRRTSTLLRPVPDASPSGCTATPARAPQATTASLPSACGGPCRLPPQDMPVALCEGRSVGDDEGTHNTKVDVRGDSDRGCTVRAHRGRGEHGSGNHLPPLARTSLVVLSRTCSRRK